ncbi:plastocyanin/azurin family copper-binding protein [Ruegeria sp. ANG-R]|uniref:plastocyanin/azurin family copper-binding protein n=1 Tax=Ruegeria sp. ANG-R TaxID=1577903 RepID=UPI00068F4DFB|nr:plastocyanin/azurin family copper-binding protein [Ruegeria sp. ANG-R]
MLNVRKALGLLLVAGTVFVAPAVQAEDLPEIAVVHQVIDLNANTPAHTFRFEPKFLQVPAGTTVRFKGSTGRHTVTAIPRMIPVGARVFEIRGKPELDLTFEKEGVYGIRCRVHGRHGMVMLLVVGDPGANLEEAKAYLPKLGEAERAGFEELFAYLEARNG